MTTSNNPDEIRAEIERTRHALGQDVDALAEKVSPTKAVSRQTNRVKDGIISMKENIMGSPEHHASPSVGDRAQDVAGQARDYAQQAGQQVGEWADSAQHAVQQAPAQVRGRTAGNPLAAGTIAFGVGMLLSALIPSSEVEQRAAAAVKDQAAPLVDEAKHVAQQVREELEPAAREAAGSLKETAADAMHAVKEEGMDKAQGLKDSSQDAAQQVKQTAQDA